MKKLFLILACLAIAGTANAKRISEYTAIDALADADKILVSDTSASGREKSVTASALKTYVNTAPGPIGSVTPNAGTFTNLTATGTVSLPTISGLSFEGSTADEFEISTSITDPTADRLIYIGNYDTRIPRSDQVNSDGTMAGGSGSGCTLVATAPYRDDAGTAGACQMTADGAYVYSTDHWEVWHLFTDTLSNAPAPPTCTAETDSEVWTTSITANSGEGSVGWVASKVVLAANRDIRSLIVSTYDPTPSGNLTVSIQTDNAGSPSGTVVSEITVTEASANSSVARQEFELTAVTLLASGTYWLVAARADAGILFGKSAGTCTNTDFKYSTNGSTWTGTTTCFEMAMMGCTP